MHKQGINNLGGRYAKDGLIKEMGADKKINVWLFRSPALHCISLQIVDVDHSILIVTV